MKIFNVRVSVQISLVATLPDEPQQDTSAPEPFNDDPVDKQSKMLSDYLKKAEKIFVRPPAQFLPGMGPDGDSASMTRCINVQAETFEELQAILQKFNQTTKELPTVPDSLLTEHDLQTTPNR